MRKPRPPGYTTAAGYGTEYQRTRARWKTQVDAGRCSCWRCGRWLDPSQPWHLGHDDYDRRIIRGPECVACNLGAAARKTNAIRRAKAAGSTGSTRPRHNPSVRW